MTDKSIVIIDAETSLYTLRIALEQRYNVTVSHTNDVAAGLDLVRSSAPDFILVNPNRIRSDVRTFFAELAELSQTTPVIIVGSADLRDELRSIYANVIGFVPAPYSESDLLPFIQPQRKVSSGGSRGKALAERAALVQSNQLLEQRVQEMMTLNQIGKAVASLTDLDAILTRIVEAAIFLLRCEESSVLLRDPRTNELYLRAQKGLGERQARGFNLKIEDTLIGSVVQTGQPVRVAREANEDQRLKVVTGYLVNALLYVPLTVRGEVIGVLGAANETASKTFNQHDQRLMEALADYAALAIEVARQHKELQRWREELNVAHSISTTTEEIRERLATDDAEILAALRRIEGAAHSLVQLAEVEAPLDV